MKTIEHVGDLRGFLDEARADGKRVGFVPTMGYFHEGHRTLMRAAEASDDVSVLSIFVNPLQFGADEDLDRYPSDPDGDCAVAEVEGIDVLFTPSVGEMYGDACLTAIHVGGLTDALCGRARPTHFDGVATVVAKLFAIVGPCRAYFGRKDYQQLAVVRRLVADLSLPVEVVGCPLVREPDGLAMSSRNAYLTASERRAARVLFRALGAGAAAVGEGVRDPAALRRRVANVVTAEPVLRLEYAEVLSAADLAPVDAVEGEVLVALAARAGKARLIDNMILRVDGEHVDADLGIVTGAEDDDLRPGPRAAG